MIPTSHPQEFADCVRRLLSSSPQSLGQIGRTLTAAGWYPTIGDVHDALHSLLDRGLAQHHPQDGTLGLWTGPRLCSWCDAPATHSLQDATGWLDHACDDHAAEWRDTYRVVTDC